nr:hypothetical protein [Tanacetum cinerariifolium]
MNPKQHQASPGRSPNEGAMPRWENDPGKLGAAPDSVLRFMSPDTSLCGCQKPGQLAARLGCAEMKVVTWDDLAFKLITLRWNVKHKNFCKIIDPRLKFESSTFALMNNCREPIVAGVMREVMWEEWGCESAKKMRKRRVAGVGGKRVQYDVQ